MQGILSRMTTAQASVGDWQALYKVLQMWPMMFTNWWGRGMGGVIGSVHVGALLSF